jgi:Holliday junction resolvasome RuvABC ATP-dependent DNA helicase subunit
LKVQSKDNLIELINKLNIKYSQFVLFIDNSHCLKPIIKTIENIKMYIVIDFYFWAIIVKKQGNQSQNYKIRVF